MKATSTNQLTQAQIRRNLFKLKKPVSATTRNLGHLLDAEMVKCHERYERELSKLKATKKYRRHLALHQELMSITKHRRHKKYPRYEVYSPQPARFQELTDMLEDVQYYTFRDGIKVARVFHYAQNDFLRPVFMLTQNGFKGLIHDMRNTHKESTTSFCRFEQPVVLEGALHEHLCSKYKVGRLYDFSVLSKYLRDNQAELHQFDRAAKLKALAAVCAA